MENIFCSIIYKYHFNNHNKILEIVNSTFPDQNYDNGLQKFSISKEEIINYYGYIIEDIIGSLENLSFISGPWLTVYSKGDKMESHSHKAFEYTLMHYIKLSDDHPQTIIEEISSGREYTPNCIEGDVLVIPGYLNHKVDVITNDQKRVVGVINFNSSSFITPQEDTGFYNSNSSPVKNILEDYIFPGEENLVSVPIPDGMCKDCYL